MDRLDAKLMTLVEERPPEKITSVEVESMITQLIRSEDLRTALLDDEQHDSYLQIVLGRAGMTVDEVRARAVDMKGRGRSRKPAFILVAIFGVALFAAGIFAGHRLSGFIAARLEPTKPENAPVTKRRDKVANAPRDDRSSALPDKFGGAESKIAATASNQGNPTDHSDGGNASPTDPSVTPPAAGNDSSRPWKSADQLGSEPRDFEELVVESVEVPSVFAIADVQRWLEPALGFANAISKDPDKPTTVSGVWKLAAPWSVDGLLRTRFNPGASVMRIHFWNGQQGVTIEDIPGNVFGWAGYRAHRASTEALPDALALASADDGLYHRYETGGATVDLPADIWFDGNAIVVSRGHTRLISVPIAGPPESVYVEARSGTEVRDIRFLRCSHFPKLPSEKLEASKEDEFKLAKRQWRVQPQKGIKFDPQDDGTVRLSADAETGPAWAVTDLPQGSLRDLIFRVDHCTPATAVILGDADDKPVYVVRFAEHVPGANQPKALGKVIQLIPIAQQATPVTSLTQQLPEPLAGDVTWLRIRIANGYVSLWAGADGRAWARLTQRTAVQNPGVPIKRVGLYCLSDADAKKNPERRITLGSIAIRPLRALAALAPSPLVSKVSDDLLKEAPANWQSKVASMKPKDADADEWFRACALRTIGGNAPHALTSPLLEQLVDGPLNSDRPLADRLELLEQYAMIFDWYSTPQDAPNWKKLADRYAKFGEETIIAGNQPSCAELMRRAFEVPLEPRGDVNTLFEPIARGEMLHRVTMNRWDSAADFLKQLALYRRAGLDPMTKWVTTIAARKFPDRNVGPAARPPAEWRHPLILEPTRQDALFSYVFKEAIEQDSFVEACRILTFTDFSDANSLLATLDNDDVWARPGMIAQHALESHPEMRDAMRDQFALRGSVRLGLAKADENPAEKISSVSVQFTSMPAGGEAHVWLGDQAVKTGRVKQALFHYAQAQRWLDDSMKATLQPRLRLAHAHDGRAFGTPVREVVVFDDKSVPPEEFEALVAAAVQSAGKVIPPLPRPLRAIAPSRLKVSKKIVWQGATNHRAASIDHLADHTDLVADGNRLFVYDNASLTAIDLAANKQLWRTAVTGASTVRTASRVEQDAERIYLRDPASHHLFGFEKATGKQLWKVTADQAQIWSDPLLVDSKLFALAVHPEQFGSTLQLVCLASHTGQVRWARPLLKLRSTWSQDAQMTLTNVGDRFVGVLAGAVVSMSLGGEIEWVKQQPWIPSALFARDLVDQPVRPLIEDGKLYVAARYSPEVQCIDLLSGHTLWNRVLPKSCRVVGSARGIVMIDTTTDLFGVDKKKGTIVWRRPVEYAPQSIAVAEQGQVMYARPIDLSKKPGVPANTKPKYEFEVVWLDAATGKLSKTAKIEGLVRDLPFLGPWITQQNKLFTIAAPEQTGPPDKRNIVELSFSRIAKHMRKSSTSIAGHNIDKRLHERASAAYLAP